MLEARGWEMRVKVKIGWGWGREGQKLEMSQS